MYFLSIFQTLQQTNVRSYNLSGNLFHILTKYDLHFCKFVCKHIFQQSKIFLVKYLEDCNLSGPCNFFLTNQSYASQFQVIREIVIHHYFVEAVTDESGSLVFFNWRIILCCRILWIQIFFPFSITFLSIYSKKKSFRFLTEFLIF